MLIDGSYLIPFLYYFFQPVLPYDLGKTGILDRLYRTLGYFKLLQLSAFEFRSSLPFQCHELKGYIRVQGGEK